MGIPGAALTHGVNASRRMDLVRRAWWTDRRVLEYRKRAKLLAELTAELARPLIERRVA